MNSKQQVIKDFEECIAFQKSVGEDTRDVMLDKQRGKFSSDTTYKRQEVSWAKLMKLIGGKGWSR